MKRAYLDANILIAYVFGQEKEPRQFWKSQAIFEDIKQGKITGIISTLTLMEIMGVFRSIKGSELSSLRGLSDRAQLEYVLQESKSMYDIIIHELLQMPNLVFEKGKQTNLQNTLTDAFAILEKIRGVVKIYDSCAKCGSDHPVSVHKAVAMVDILHALIAKDVGCDVIITFDKGFNELKSHEKFDSIEFDVR